MAFLPIPKRSAGIALWTFLLFMASEVQAQGWRDLSGPERRWVLCHPIAALRARPATAAARHLTDSLLQAGRLNGGWNGGEADAFRHACWMGLVAARIGTRKARQLGEVHERGNRRQFERGKLEDGALADARASEMDLWNNEVGLRLEAGTDSREALVSAVLEALATGELRLICTDGDGQTLDCEGNVLPPSDYLGKWENKRCLCPSGGPAGD